MSVKNPNPIGNDKDNNNQYTILDLPKLIGIAREHTLLGCYEKSLKKYNIVLEIIQARQKEINVGILKDKWRMTELNIKSEIAQTKQMLEACKVLSDTDFNYFKKQIADEDLQKQKMKQKGILVFDMSNNDKRYSMGPNLSHFGGKVPFSFGNNNLNVTQNDPFSAFGNDEINKIGGKMANLNVNDDEEGILNPLKPQKRFSSNLNRKKSNSYANQYRARKSSGGKMGQNPWKNNKNKNSSDKNLNVVSNIPKEKSFMNPLEEFNISKSNIGGANDTTFMNL